MADETIPNPERGCGRLKRSKAYIRGVIGGPGGILPSFVRCDPPITYREMTTEGGFTRGFLEFDGSSAQFALDDITDFVREYPGEATDEQAVENMVAKDIYPDSVGDDQPTDHMSLTSKVSDTWTESGPAGPKARHTSGRPMRFASLTC